MRFLFFTKTDWIEPPRLRHQLARLLADAGHQVIFFQRPYFFWQRIPSEYFSNAHIAIYRYHQLIHHKFRFFSFLHNCNALFEISQIRRLLSGFSITSEDVVVNFNYDYFFLKSLFRSNRIITIINDDFWSGAIGGYQDPLKWALKRVIQNSDTLLTVSYPLQFQLSETGHADLFPPWSDSCYISPPSASLEKDTILYWGFINNRLDFKFIANLAKEFSETGIGFKILLVGPIRCAMSSLLLLENLHNVEIRAASDLDSIDLTQIFSAFIPYKSGIKDVDAITYPNKLFRLLSRGLPIAITGMPYFIEEPFVFRLSSNLHDSASLVKDLHDKYAELQPIIKCFVNKNLPEHRLQQFMNYV